uniref:Ketoreductase domain-containing protein n=1 Tax=Alexandrium andersonii TaxID=327968 RepID=A0A7S2DXM8_9DINO
MGLVAAETLAEAGAQCLVLSSKSGDVPKGMGVERRIQMMQEKDVTVVVEKCDTGKDREVEKLLDRIRSTYGAVTAVVHCAGLTADSPMEDLDAGMMTHVFEPKAQGAYYLHKHTQEDELFSFLMFSSVAAQRGSSNQANYAASCTYLDELARLRSAQGLPGVSVQWPGLDLSGRTVKDDSALGLATVKQVIKQLVCGREPVEPVQAVLPAAYLTPSSPLVRPLLDLLTARANPQMAGAQGQQAEKTTQQGQGPKAPRVYF